MADDSSGVDEEVRLSMALTTLIGRGTIALCIAAGAAFMVWPLRVDIALYDSRTGVGTTVPFDCGVPLTRLTGQGAKSPGFECRERAWDRFLTGVLVALLGSLLLPFLLVQLAPELALRLLWYGYRDEELSKKRGLATPNAASPGKPSSEADPEPRDEMGEGDPPLVGW